MRQELIQPDKLITKTFPVQGMTCASCANSVNTMLESLEGVKSASVNYANNSAQVTFDPGKVNVQDFQKTIEGIGYTLLVEDESSPNKVEELKLTSYKKLKTQTFLAVVFSIPLMLVGMVFMDIPFANYIMWALATPVLFLFGKRFFINAFKQAKYGKANMDTLVALSTGIAYIFSIFNTLFPDFWLEKGLIPHVYFEASAVIISFILLGKLLEEKAKNNTSGAIKKLMGLQPKTVIVITERGSEKSIPIEQVNIGDIILVKPGEKIAVDGKLISGESYVNESMISGEPVPVFKNKGESVFAGTINEKGSFRFEAQKIGSETVLAQIIQMVEKAQGSKAPVQKYVDKIAGIFVPIVIAIAVLTFLTWMIFGGENAFSHALLTSITVLVIACPCALGLATPTAIMVGVGKGAENGILIKDAESLEMAKKVDAVVLDKTGTITEGKPAVTDVIWFGDKNQYAPILLSLEKLSEHPLADAVTEYLSKSHQKVHIDSFNSVTGKGIEGVYDGVNYFVGNQSFMEFKGIKISQELYDTTDILSSEAKTVIYFADDTQILAILAIADRIKKTSIEAISRLKKAGIAVHMLTGDNEKTAKAVATHTGIDFLKAQVLPSEKGDYIRSLREDGRTVAMVGDGINDAQALVEADVSIAMGKGTDIAMDVAKMTIISDDLNKISTALKLSTSTVKTINQNLFWAFIYNLIGIPIAAGILYPIFGFLLNPMIAGAAMALSSVSVVSNSLRLKYKKFQTGHLTQATPSLDKEDWKVNEIEKPTPENSKSNKEMKKYSFKTNINCAGCVSAVTPHLSNVSGINNWNVDTANPDKVLTVESDLATAKEVEDAVKKAGFEVRPFDRPFDRLRT